MRDALPADMIDAWLSGSRRFSPLRFPKTLEQSFEDDTRRDRSRTLSNGTAVGFGIGCLLYLAMTATTADVPAPGRMLFLGVAMPLGFLAAVILRLDPHPVLREAVTTLVNLVCVWVTALSLAQWHTEDASYFFATVTIQLIYSVIGVQLRFGYAAFACVATIGAYAVGLAHSPGIPFSTGRNLLLLAAMIGSYLLLANRRLERELRRNYLVALRDRLQRQDLSTRNRELDELARCDPLTTLA